MKVAKLLTAAACAAAVLLPAAASAQSADDWRYDAIIYVYLPSIGSTTTFPQTGGSDSASIDNMKSGEKIHDLNFNGPAIGVAFHW